MSGFLLARPRHNSVMLSLLAVVVAAVLFAGPLHVAVLQVQAFVSPSSSKGARTTAASTRQQQSFLNFLNNAPRPHERRQDQPASRTRLLRASADDATDTATTSSTATDPIVFASGYSQKPDLVEALREATEMAAASLPSDSNNVIDLCIVSVSSLYDGGIHPPSTVVVPTILETLKEKYAEEKQLKQLIGSSVAGCIGSSPATKQGESCSPTEIEGMPAVTVAFAILPETDLRVFYVSNADVPDDYGRFPAKDWRRVVGLTGFAEEGEGAGATPPNFLLMPSPAFATELDDFLQGISTYFPGSQTVGGVASTVSSLSRAKLYCWRNNPNNSASTTNACYTDGCVGVGFDGDFAMKQMTTPGAKPVGGIYQILQGQESTIGVIVLDEAATDALADEDDEEKEEEEEEEEDENLSDREKMQNFYAKARIPKPVLAEANFLMRTLSDDDQAFMRRQLLVGLEQGGNIGRTASELKRLASGEGHRFTVHQVARGGMKDGSVTLPLGSVDIQPGTRFRFFVRESDFAKKEIDASWLGYKQRLLSEQFDKGEDDEASFTPAACFLVPTLDRGNKFFLGKPGYESNAAARVLAGIPCIIGFFSNGVIGKMDVSETARTGLQGSASGYFLLGSRSGRPIYSPASAAVELAEKKEEQALKDAEARQIAAEDEKRAQRAQQQEESSSSAAANVAEERAPRTDDGELVLKRREVHSGRALTVSTVEWSVAEKTAQPSSTLEGFMWDKETEVDRFRERVPLANLVSQCRLASVDPTSPKPRDWIGPLKEAAASQGFVIVPECKRTEPTTGSLRKRYDLAKLVREFTLAGVPVTSVNCDGVLFGGSLEDVTAARKAASTAAVEQMSEDGVVVPPILASDLVLYPYQLYKLSLAGADAVNLVAGALQSKDLMYLTKIASSLNLQTLITVTSEFQIQLLSSLPVDSFHGLILSNRELEDFSFDATGEQAIRLLKSDGLRELREKRGDDFPVLVEGRVGIIERQDESGVSSPYQYLKEIKEAGAAGAIVGGGLVSQSSDGGLDAYKTLQAEAIV